jgi:hypothetical protein
MTPFNKHLLILCYFVLFGFFARAATFKSPLFDHHAWRQADTASISRNFYRERFNILYPQVDQRGAGTTGYVETGLELFAFVVAALAKVVGFHTEIGRLLSALLFVCSELLVWAFVKRRDGPRRALVAAFLYAFGFPLALYIERAFMNEALLICLSLLCLVSAQRYLTSCKRADLVVLIVASALIGAIKLPYLIIWAPVVGLFVETDGVRTWRRWELWLMAAVDLTAAAMWYLHAHELALASGLTFGMSDKLFDARLVFSPSFVPALVMRLLKDVLGPVGLIGVVAGTWFAARERRWCDLFALAAFAAYLLLVAKGNYIHDYYQLAIMPIAPSLAAFGLVRLSESILVVTFLGLRSSKMLAWAMAIAALTTFIRSASFHSWYEYSTSEVEFCDTVRDLGPPTERVVFVGNNDPKLLFCIDRKGWLLAWFEADEPHVRSAWNAGAKLAIVQRANQNADLRRFLTEVGTPVPSGRNVDAEVFRLR